MHIHTHASTSLDTVIEIDGNALFMDHVHPFSGSCRLKLAKAACESLHVTASPNRTLVK
jgi:hypothetical protein